MKSDYHTFLSETNLSEIKNILVIANTGQVTIKLLQEWLTHYSSDTTPHDSIGLQLLLRSPHISDRKRADSIHHTIKQLKLFSNANPRFLTQVRYYASVCPLRATIFEHSSGAYSGYLSFVDWGPDANLNWRDSAHKHAFIRRAADASEPFISVFLSWFRHFWGHDQIHTLIFDFDDTLFFTTGAQVHGWMRAIELALERGDIRPEQLSDDVQAARSSGSYERLMVDIFFEEQEEDRILRRILKHDISQETLDAIRQERIKARERKTLCDALPIPNVINDLEWLSTQYQFVIVSSTSEELIRGVLKKHGLNGLFPYVFGRDSPLRAWHSVEKKAQNFIKISTMLGIPLERMVFIGDSDADYRAARQLGLPFIENRFNVERYGRSSLIRQLDSYGCWSLSSTTGMGDLGVLIKRIQAQLK